MKIMFNKPRLSPTPALDRTVALRFSELCAYYPGRPVLQQVSGEITKLATTALVGPNGSGKSTLLGVFAGVIKPTSGDLFRSGDRQPAFVPQRGRSVTRFPSPFGRPWRWGAGASAARGVSSPHGTTRPWTRPSTGSASATSPHANWASCQAGSVNAPSSPRGSRRSRTSCSSMSRPPAWTRRPGTGSGRCWWRSSPTG